MIRVCLVEDQTLVREGLRSLLDLIDDIEVVAEARDGEDYDLIRDLTEELSEATTPFAQRIMDSSIQEALGEKRLSEL